ncbi:MAG: ABC transporter substrate-binding protein [Alkalispirochaeta sp.]
MKSKIRFLLTAALIPLVASVLASCSPRSIVLGFQGPLTGSAADLGVQGRNGALLAVETINAAGGVRGRSLRLEPRDDCNDQQVAHDLVEAFREDGVEVVIGPMTSVAGVAVAERVAETGPLYISPTVSTARVSGRDDYFFRLEGATDRQAEALGDFVAVSALAERVAIVLDTGNSEYSIPYMAAFTEGLTDSGGTVVQSLELALDGGHRWNRAIATIADEQPDAVLVIASAADTARFAQAVRSENLNWDLLASGWAATETLFTLGGAAVEGMVLARTSYSSLSDTEQGMDFRNRFAIRFGKTPSFAASQAYDAVLLVAGALERSAPVASELREEVSTVTLLDTLLGPVTFDQFGDIEPSATIVRVEQSDFVEVVVYGDNAGSQ